MSAVGLEQKRSEVVGSGSNLCRARYFSDFTDIYSFTETNFHSFVIPPLTHKIFLIPEIFWKTGGIPYQIFRFGPVKQNFLRQFRDAPSYASKFSMPEFF